MSLNGRYHRIKLNVKYFSQYLNRKKNYEYRINDRDYRVGDDLIMICVDDEGKSTHKYIRGTINDVFHCSEVNSSDDKYVILNLCNINLFDFCSYNNCLIVL